MANYITQTDVEARLSAAVLAAITDDDNDGDGDTAAIDLLIEQGEAYVDGAVEAIYPDLLPFDPVPREIKRLALDAVEYYAARRHPEIVRRDWRVLKEVLDEDLSNLRLQKRTIGERPPDPAANQGGTMVPTVSSGDLIVPIFSGCKGQWGIF